MKKTLLIDEVYMKHVSLNFYPISEVVKNLVTFVKRIANYLLASAGVFLIIFGSFKMQYKNNDLADDLANTFVTWIGTALAIAGLFMLVMAFIKISGLDKEQPNYYR